MRNWNNKKLYLVLTLILPILLVGLLNSSKITIAQPQYDNQTQTLAIPSNISIYEFSSESETKVNISSIDIKTPSASWNLTDLEVNFTDIMFERELKMIEDQDDDSNSVDKNNIKGLAVQINITDITILYGVQIYGKAISPDDDDDVYIQIQGYDSLNNHPDSIPLREIRLNMSTELKWYSQIFSFPISLSKGNYSLVMNRTTIRDPWTKYRWYHSYLTPYHPELYVSKDGGTGWNIGYNRSTYMYKLDQQLNYTFKPTDINMHAEIYGYNFPVLNGVDPIKGNLSIPDVDYSSITNSIPISIENNKSSSLLFNATYNFKIKNIFNSRGQVLINENFNNSWIFTLDINRVGANYSVQFEYPDSWFNVTVFKNNLPLTPDLDYIDNNIENMIYILNDTITPNSKWNMTSNSEKIHFGTSIPLNEYEEAQTVKITINNIPPSLDNNYITILILDSFGDISYNNTLTNPSVPQDFFYTIPTNPFEGTWKVLIYWNNNTDGGLEVLTFQIIISDEGGGNGDKDTTIITGLDPQQVFFIALIIIIGVVGALTSYQAVKRHNIKKERYRQKIYNKYMDILTLNYIMISDKRTGLNLYEQFISGKEMDPTLISGFLQAIRTFGIELTGSEDQSQSIRLEYQKSKILMSEFKDFRVINIFEESPSKDFMDSLTPLTQDIDKYYGKSIKNFDGNVSKFKGVKELLERHLQVALVYPLKVVEPKTLKLDVAEKTLVKKALDIMKKKNSDYFYVSYLLSEKEYNIKNAEKILKLIEKKVFRPVE